MVAGDQSIPVDCLVIGSGPAGYATAIRAAQLGRAVTVVERSPAALAADTGRRLRKAGVTLVHGEARFVGSTRIGVQANADRVRYFDFNDVVIATGSEPVAIHDLPVDGRQVVFVDTALTWDEAPDHVLVVGVDANGLELAVWLARRGSRVGIAERGNRLLPELDADLSRALQDGSAAAGIEVVLNTNPRRPTGGEVVVIAAGRQPAVDSLDLAAAGLRAPKGGFAVDPQLRIARHVFAVGAVTASVPSAQRATAQGRVAGDVLGGKPSAMDQVAIPRVVRAEPEVATVGPTPEEAQAHGIDVGTATFPLASLRQPPSGWSPRCFTKLVFNRADGRVLGAHLAGPNAAEVIAEAGLAIEMGATLEDLALTVHPTPSLAETLAEAAEVGLGRSIFVLGGN